MNIYEDNLCFLEKNAPVLYNTLNYEEALFEIKLTEINNDFQIVYDGKRCYANSTYNILDEMNETFKYVDKNCEVLVVLGIGNGEVIKYIKDNFKFLKGLFIIEPFLDVFKKYIKETSFRNIFDEMGLITFIVNKDENTSSELMRKIFENEKYSSLEVVSLCSYGILLQKYYKTFKERVLIGFRSRISQFVTLHNSRYKWLNNTLSNFRFPHYDQDDISSIIKGKPAVIVGAGPSLEKHFDLLEELKQKAVIIGAGSAIKILNSRGIKPHFRIAIDGNPDENIYDETFYDNSSDIPLLYASQLFYDVLPKYNGDKIFMMLPTDVLGQYIYKKMNKHYQLVSSGASVVQSAFSFLCKAGCNPIIFIGQDMCFYDNELYAQGRNSDKLSNYDQKRYIKMKDIFDNDVYTIRNYLQIKYDYETMLKDYKDIRFINATEGGLGIDGTEVKALTDVINEDIKTDVTLNLRQDLNALIKQKKNQTQDLSPVFKDIVSEIDQILLINKKRLKLLKSLTKSRLKRTKKINKLKIEFHYIDSTIENQLNDIDFYKSVIINNVSVESMALKHKYKTIRNDDLGNLEKGEKYLYGMITEVEIFCSVCKEFIEEYFNINIEGSEIDC